MRAYCAAPCLLVPGASVAVAVCGGGASLARDAVLRPLPASTQMVMHGGHRHEMTAEVTHRNTALHGTCHIPSSYISISYALQLSLVSCWSAVITPSSPPHNLPVVAGATGTSAASGSVVSMLPAPAAVSVALLTAAAGVRLRERVTLTVAGASRSVAAELRPALHSGHMCTGQLQQRPPPTQPCMPPTYNRPPVTRCKWCKSLPQPKQPTAT